MPKLKVVDFTAEVREQQIQEINAVFPAEVQPEWFIMDQAQKVTDELASRMATGDLVIIAKMG